MSRSGRPLRILALLACWLVLAAADFYQVAHESTETIDEHGECREVTNNHASSKALFVPTKTSGEWASFRSGVPGGVTAVACGDTLSNGLLLHWAFDEGSGSTANDSSGNGNHGTLANGAGWSDGRISGGMECGGDTSLAFRDEVAGMPGAGDWAVSIWVKPLDDLNSSTYRRFTTQLGPDFDWSMMLLYAEGSIFGGYARETGGEEILTHTQDFAAGTWMHLALVHEELSSLRLYLNGVEVDSKTGGVAEIAASSTRFEAGGLDGADLPPLSGPR